MQLEYNQHFSSQLQTQLLYFCKCWLVAYRLARLLIAYYSFCSTVKIMKLIRSLHFLVAAAAHDNYSEFVLATHPKHTTVMGALLWCV